MDGIWIALHPADGQIFGEVVTTLRTWTKNEACNNSAGDSNTKNVKRQATDTYLQGKIKR